MLRPWKRPTGAVDPEKKGQSEKHTKSENSGEASGKGENSSLQKTSAFKKCGRNLSNYWLMKSEPESQLEKGVDVKFSTEDIKAESMLGWCWKLPGMKFLRAMKLEEEAFFYHSNCNEPGFVGRMKVNVQFVQVMKHFISLAELKTYYQFHKATGGPLKYMAFFTHEKLSIQLLIQEEFDCILSLKDNGPS